MFWIKNTEECFSFNIVLALSNENALCFLNYLKQAPELFICNTYFPSESSRELLLLHNTAMRSIVSHLEMKCFTKHSQAVRIF